MSLSGWNTWDTYTVTSLSYAQTGLRLRAGVVDVNTSEARREIRLPDMLPGPDLVGPRTADGSYIEWRVQQENFRILLQMTAEDATLVWRIHPEIWPDNLLLEIDISYPWGEPLLIARRGGAWVTGDFEITALPLISDRCSDEIITVDLRSGDAILTAGKTGFFSPIDVPDAEVILSRARAECCEREFQSDGYLRDAARALSRGAFWDTIWEPRRDRPLPTFSREWNVRFGGFVDAPADNFAQAASTGLFHKRLAELNIEEMLTEANPQGMVPNIGSASDLAHDRSEPPNGSHSALKLYKSFGDISFLERVYPGLARWNRWWYEYRDGNGDGLLEWGADPVTDPNNRYYNVPGKRRAMWELCADNSALYEDVDYNEQTHTLEMSDVGLNAYLALDAWSLREIALILGHDEDAREFERKYADLRDKVNEHLWNEEHGIYLDKRWDGRFVTRYEPQLFFPMVAGIAPPERARRMIDEYFLNETKFWGEFPLPSISRDDPAFPENTYYRGRIWGEQVHLVAEGLRRYEMDEEAHEFSRRLLKMYLAEWEQHSHSHENYNSVTGVGDDVKNATADYAALGGMMAHVAIQELVDVEAWGALRFGNLSDDAARVRNVLIGSSNYEIQTGGKLIVRRDGKVVVESDVPVIIRGLPSPAFSPATIELRIKSKRPGTVKLMDLPESANINVTGAQSAHREGGRMVLRV